MCLNSLRIKPELSLSVAGWGCCEEVLLLRRRVQQVSRKYRQQLLQQEEAAEGAEGAADVGVKMNLANDLKKNCPLCHKEVYSEIGKSCKMCGMYLEDAGKEFCSRECRTKFGKINQG